MHRLQKYLRAAEEGTRGVCSVCSAHPWVVRAAAEQAVEDGSPLLIEATSNQVNLYESAKLSWPHASVLAELFIAFGIDGIPPVSLLLSKSLSSILRTRAFRKRCLAVVCLGSL